MTVEEIFAEAIAHRDPGVRSQYVASACGGNPELMARVAALLAAHDRASSFLELPAVASAQTADCAPPAGIAGRFEQTPLLAQDETVGAVIGRYKLLQRIGEGGF